MSEERLQDLEGNAEGSVGVGWWYVILLVVNTLGILEIIYLFAITGAKLSDFTKGLGNQQK